jgi:hypothetical protein
MKIFYYKLFKEENNEFLGVASSLDLVYYNIKSNMFLRCLEKDAQYIGLNGQLYKTFLFQKEKKVFNFPSVFLKMATKEEHQEFLKKQQEKEKLE